jgi:type II secretory pathway component GspD/PulD (secretin)
VGENGPAARPLLGSFGALYRTPVGFNANLFAAVNNNRGKVLSNPNLTALDGQTATAFIGDQIKYVTQIQQTLQGQTVTTETATVGITLKVTGRYSPDGTITLSVHPEVSAISSFLSISQGISLPQISTRYVDTTVRVKDGETIAIGGLIRNNEIKNLQRIPLLSDIPFFGELFKYRSNTKQQSEIVVFITSRLAAE